MILDNPEFIPFLQRAKSSTYAASENAPELFSAPSRTQSHDLAYREGDWAYLDSYLGGLSFIGEEAVWHCGQPVWGMNYYGAMLPNGQVDGAPEGFSGFLKLALSNPPADAPYRGPAALEQGGYRYECRWQGDPREFWGDENIALDGQVVYRLRFHGGLIR
jgi:hypothetical protein